MLAPVHDPFAVGLRRRESADLITKVLKKTCPTEKVGMLVQIDGRDAIVEYSDLSPQQVEEKTPDENAQAVKEILGKLNLLDRAPVE